MKKLSNRRNFLKGVVGLASVSSLPTHVFDRNQASKPSAWSMFQYDASNSGYNASAAGPINGKRQRWSVSAESAIQSSPAVSAESVFFLTSGGVLHSIDRNTGVRNWTHPVDPNGSGSNRSSPALSGDTVYVGSGDKRLYALSLSGDERWSKGTGGGIFSSPTILENNIFIGSTDGKLYSFRENGESNWQSDLAGPVVASPAVSENSVFVGCSSSSFNADNFFAVTHADGSQRWSFQTEGDVTASAALSNDDVFIGDDRGNIYDLNQETGNQRWRTSLSNSISSTLVVTDTVVCVVSGNWIYALQKDDGSEAWTYKLTESYYGNRNISASEKTLYVGDLNGTIRGIREGIEEWRFSASEDDILGIPAVVGDTVYFGDESGSFYAVTDRQGGTTADSSSNSSTMTGTTRAPDSEQLTSGRTAFTNVGQSSDNIGNQQNRNSPSGSASNSDQNGSLLQISLFDSLLGIIASLVTITIGYREYKRRKK